MKKIIIILFVFLLIIIGCVTFKQIKNEQFFLDSFIGQNINDAYLYFGEPIKTYKTDTNKFIQYILYTKKCYNNGDHKGCLNPENEYKYLIFQIDNKGVIKAWIKREF